jgi:hypothetical protein
MQTIFFSSDAENTGWPEGWGSRFIWISVLAALVLAEVGVHLALTPVPVVVFIIAVVGAGLTCVFWIKALRDNLSARNGRPVVSRAQLNRVLIAALLTMVFLQGYDLWWR